MMMRFLYTAILYLSCMSTYAGVVRGIVRDSKTGEALVGATVSVKGETRNGTTSGLDGTFVLKTILANTVVVECNCVSYAKYSKELTVSTTGKNDIVIELTPSQLELQTVEVVATNKTTDYGALSLEKLSPNVVNIISARAMELSPDITVANVVQRVSGVSVERNSNGDGQYAILRGMDKRYNYTLVNGIKIPSPDNKNRFVPLDIFPAELLDRLEVTKSLTPEMEGDAIGGTVNMIMKDAPSHFKVTFNLATGYNSLFFNHDFLTYNTKDILKQSPYERYGAAYPAKFKDFPAAVVDLKNAKALPNLLGGFSVGNRFLNKKLGVILAASFQSTNRGNNSRYFSSQTASSDASNLPVLKDYQSRMYSNQQIRYGVHGKIDYLFSKNHKLQLYSAFIGLENNQVRDTKSINLEYGYRPSTNDYSVSYDTRFRQNSQTIFTNTLHGEHEFLNKMLILDWNAVYSKAENQTPDNSTVYTKSTVTGGVEGFISVADKGEVVRWEHNSDQDKAAYFKAVVAADKKLSVTTGAMYRTKSRSNFYNEYTFTPYDSDTKNTNLIKGINWNNYSQISFAVKNPFGSVGDPLNYDASENISAGFFQFKFENAKWKILAGLRLEHTIQGYNLLHAVDGVKNTGNQEYNDWLPGINLKYSPWLNHNFRLSYFRSINRPSFFEIVPYNVVNEDFTEKGNPDLKHTVADNFDARYEFFPKPTEQFMVGLFHKRIKDPIEYGMVSAGQGSFFMPDNFGSATNYGIELDAIKYFNAFGIKANYTYTKSQITTTKLLNYTDDSAGSSAKILTKNVNQTRPLYGQSPSVANLALLYKNSSLNFDVQVMGVFTGKRLYAISRYYENDMWEKESFQLDASLEKRWGTRWSFFAKSSNLLNSPMILYLKQKNPANDIVQQVEFTNGGTLVRKDYYGVQIQFGVRMKLD